MEQSKLHILLIIEGTYPWHRGGVSEWVFQYITACKDYNFTILQIATEKYGKLNPSNALYDIPENVENFLRIPPPEFSLNWEKNAEAWFYSTLDVQCLESNICDLIHSTNTGFAGWAGKELSKKFTIPLILTEHASYWKEVQAGTTALECGYKIPCDEELKSDICEIFKTIAIQVYAHSEHVISVSKTNLGYQKKLGAKNPLYIPNGAEPNLFLKDKIKSPFFTVGWVGRCAEMKNPLKFLDLAELLYELAEVDIHFKMLICDSNEKDLNNIVKKRTGHLPFVEVVWNQPAIEHISEMDMICLTSISESQPLVLFEALAMKVLPIGWEIGDFTSEFGLAVPEDTEIQELAEMILSLWNDKHRFYSLVNEKYNAIKPRHNWPAIFGKYRTLINSMPQIQNKYGKAV